MTNAIETAVRKVLEDKAFVEALNQRVQPPMSLADDAMSILAAGGKGATAGAALGPVGAAAGAAIGVAMDLLPGAAHWLGADAQTARKAVDVVQTLTGSTDPAAQREAIAADQGLADDLKVQLAQIANERRAEGNRSAEAFQAAANVDTAGARQQTVQLAQAGSRMAWGAAVVSTIVLMAFAVMTWVVVSHSIPQGSEQISMVMLGTLGTLATSVVSYWVGSSAGSARKTELAAMREPIPPNPAVVVPAKNVQSK
jgi:hypothetical protein